MAEVEEKIEFKVPSRYWMGEELGAAHQGFRRTTPGKIENLGPSQPFRYVTGEIRNTHYKYANVTGTPWDMYLNIIPGMHPFQWDLISVFVTFGAPILGAIDGIIDDEHEKARIEGIYRKSLLPKIIEIKKPTRTKSDLEKLYGDKPPTIVNYGNDTRFSFNYGLRDGIATPGVYENENIDNIVWKEGANANYTMQIEGKIEGAQIKRSHKDHD